MRWRFWRHRHRHRYRPRRRIRYHRHIHRHRAVRHRVVRRRARRRNTVMVYKSGINKKYLIYGALGLGALYLIARK